MKVARLVDLLTEKQAIEAAKKGIEISDTIDILTVHELFLLSGIVIDSNGLADGRNLVCLAFDYLVEKANKKDLEIFI